MVCTIKIVHVNLKYLLLAWLARLELMIPGNATKRANAERRMEEVKPINSIANSQFAESSIVLELGKRDNADHTSILTSMSRSTDPETGEKLAMNELVSNAAFLLLFPDFRN